MFKKIFNRAVKDTRQALDIKEALVYGTFMVLLSIPASGQEWSFPALLNIFRMELAISAVIVALAVFIAKLILAPYRIQKERADEAKKKLESLGLHTEIPNSHLQALGRYDATITDLGEKQILISSLVQKYVELRNSSISNNSSFGRDLDYEELFRISELIIGQINRYIPPPPDGPKTPLKIYLGWNHYLVIFNVPMRIPPEITISNIPDGSHAEVSNVTNISFEVKFWPENIQVTNFNMSANAEL